MTAVAAYVFCERASGAVRFRVDAEADGAMPSERAASMMAMHCLIRHQKPADYHILIDPRNPDLSVVYERAEDLLERAAAMSKDVRISPRERDVLDCVCRNLSNKLIADKLHIAERTVKFHVSSLFAKFNVRDRQSLMRDALGQLSAGTSSLFGIPEATA